MKISKEEKEKTRRRLVEAAVQVIATRGFRDATMREIAERAQVGDATIYKYFPSKEDLLSGFFELRLETLIARLREVADFHQYRFREQLHVLLETQLALFAADRDFLRIAYQRVFLGNWLGGVAGSSAAKRRFLEVVDDLVTSAVEAGEFDEPPFKPLFYELLWEYAIGITYYWLKDSSPKYVNTTQMIDKSLAVLDAALESNVLGRAADLLHFLIREHVLTRIQGTGQERPSDGRRPKRAFLADRQPGRRRGRGGSSRRKAKS